MAKLFIAGFPWDMEETELLELFTAYGAVNAVIIITDQLSGQSKGYGFITMGDVQAAARAIEALDGAEIDDRRVSVRLAEEKKQAARPAHERKTETPAAAYRFRQPGQSRLPEISGRDVPCSYKKTSFPPLTISTAICGRSAA